ncbi:CotO family spore coat protein [Bacillus sp. NPDC077027]|uniref:CotO family spore coat protein n=1 Tax=Bacillus sp. NPDC077027 TaxID=3390548 RepID=UPI003CFEA375
MPKKDDENQKPLMYIVQPSYEDTQPAMQNIVRKRKKSEKTSSHSPSNGVGAEAMKEEPASQVVDEHKQQETSPQLSNQPDVERKIEKYPEAVLNAKKEEPNRKRVKKPLSQMTIEEKVDFLTRLPLNMPRALCLIEAEEKTYRGIVVERKEGIVIVRTTGGGNPVELPIETITSIHPLGF